MRLLGLSLLSIILFTCTEKTTINRPATTILLISSLNQFNTSDFHQQLSTLVADKKYKIDTTSQLDQLQKPLIESYSTLVLHSPNINDWSPQDQSKIEQYVQAGGGLVFVDTQKPDKYRWPFYQAAYQLAERQAKYEGGKIVRTTSNDQAKLAKDLAYAIGKNKYDLSKITAPQAPNFDRFTKVPLDTDMNEPMELAVLPNGSVLYIERRGKMKLYNNSLQATSLIHNFDVCTAGNYEDGLLGLALAPRYGRDNQWLYLYYSPPCDTLSQFLSRFNFYDDSLDVQSEVVLLKVDVQRETCCHSGGSIAFGPDGLLYLSTGDNTSSKESDGFSPIDERPGRAPFDAQKSSGNTNDLRGKILRIRPLPDGTYTIPDGNLFAKDGSKGRPEIYIMGARNPFRIAVDHKTNYLYWGDVGPDGGTDGKYGPQSYDEWNQARQAGNYGWPFFGADNKAYPDRDFTTGEVGPLPDPARPVNRSPYNTGDSILPPALPAMIWYPYGESPDFPMLGSGGRSAMAGPIYYQDQIFSGSKIKLPEYYNGKLFIYEWVRNWINVCTFNEAGDLIKIEPFLNNQRFAGPLDMEIGPDGAIYLLEYGNAYFLNNPEAMISRIEFAADNRKPVPIIATSGIYGIAPMTVDFDASKSFDYDQNDSLTYEWFFTNTQKPEATGPKTQFTFDKKGTFEATLLVSDSQGARSTTTQTIYVGNQPPSVEIVYEGNQSFYFENVKPKYKVLISDPEDEKNGGINFNNASLDFSYLQDGDYFHQLTNGDAKLPEGKLQFAKGKQLIEDSDCRTCHQNEKQTIGPSYMMIAKKYKNRYDAVEYLAEKVIKGGNGVWGKSMMSAHPDITREQAAEMAQYVLSLNDKNRLPLKGRVAFADHPNNSRGGGYVLTASYEDKGANNIQPIKNRHIKLLRSPIVEAEHCQQRSGMGERRFGIGLNQTLLTAYSDKAHLVFEQLDLSDIRRIELAVQGFRGGKISIRLNRPEGPLIGQLSIEAGEGREDEWKTYKTAISSTSGLKDIYFIFEKTTNEKGPIANIDWINFLAK